MHFFVMLFPFYQRLIELPMIIITIASVSPGIYSRGAVCGQALILVYSTPGIMSPTILPISRFIPMCGYGRRLW